MVKTITGVDPNQAGVTVRENRIGVYYQGEGMVSFRLALLIGAITAVAVSPASANFRAPRCCDPCGSTTTAFAFRNVACTQWVRETVPVKRTVNKIVCKTEEYETTRCERVPVVKEREVCVTKMVPTWETRKVCHKETVWEERTVNKTSYKYVQETVNKKQLVRLGHWECREVQPIFGGFGSGGLFAGHGCGHACGHQRGCNDACGKPAAANACNNACRPAHTVRVWVNCPEYRDCPTTVCKKVCTTEAVKCKVAVCKNVWKEEKVCVNKCVTEKRMEKCTVWETRQVKCKATRTVRVCVPTEETVNCTRWVRKQVAPAAPCATTAAPCRTTTSNACCDRGSLFGGLRDRLASLGCRDHCHSHRNCCRPASCCK